jgi:hypothetical protein
MFGGVNDTGKKFITPVNNIYFSGVVDTVQKKKPKSLKFFGGVSDTGD